MKSKIAFILFVPSFVLPLALAFAQATPATSNSEVLEKEVTEGRDTYAIHTHIRRIVSTPTTK